MITQKRRKYFRLLSIVISFVMIVTAIPFIPVVADIEEGIASMLPDPIEPIEESDSEGSTTFALDPNGLCPANLEDGVYAIKNVGNSTSTYSMFMDMAHNHWFPEYHIQQNKYTGTQTPCDPFSPRALFKITKNGNSYVIRVLRNSLLSFQLTETSRGYEYLTVEIPQVDEDVPYASRFSIMETTMYSNEYVITQCNTSKYVSAQATAAYGDEGTPGSYLFGSDSITAFSTWTFVKYTGEERSSVNMLGWGSLVTGTQMMFYPVFYSTRPGYNILSLDIQSPGAGNYSVDESNPYGKIRLTPYTDQDIVVDVKVGNGVDSYTIATQTWPVRLVVEEDIYFLKNVKFDNRYVQINNTSDMYKENEIIELHNFHGYYEQRWRFTHLWNGYYKIESTYSGKVLTCPTGPNNNVVRQTTFTNALTQSWKIVEQSDGTYKMYAGSNSNCYMTAGTPTATADPDLIVRSPQSDGGDKWYIRTPAYSYSTGGEFHNGEDVIDAYKNWLQCGYISDYKINPGLSDLNESNLNSEIVYFSAHGTQYSISFINGTKLTYNNHFIGSEKRIAINDYSLTDAKLYIYDACETDSNKNGTGENLCTATIAAGVDCVIGWTESIDSGDAIIWQGRFQNKLASGDSVIDAANYANTFCYSFNATIKSWRIYGNSNLTVNESSSSFVFDETLKSTNIAYPEHSNQAIATILRNTFDDFSDDAANIIITYTNHNNSDYVIDYYYLYNGFLTSSGYSIVVQNGIITQIRDNTSVSNRQSVYRLNVPIITQDIIDNAMCQARAELSATDNDYSIFEQYGEGYYCIEKGIYYYRVMTIYETSDNTYGAFCTYYQM